jgi:hypothetical protein
VEPRNEEEIQEDLKKHLNIDFTEHPIDDDSQGHYLDEQEDFDGEDVRNRGMSLAVLENTSYY